MLFADSEDEKKLWLLYKYSWGGTVVAGLDAVPLCTTPTPPPSSAAWPLGAAAQAAALHSKAGAWLKPCPMGNDIMFGMLNDIVFGLLGGYRSTRRPT